MTDDDIRALMETAVPGPWTTEYLNNDAYQVVSHEQRAVIAKLVYENHDARLIAAAPDLAAECLDRGAERDAALARVKELESVMRNLLDLDKDQIRSTVHDIARSLVEEPQ